MLWVLLNVLDHLDEVRDLREERIIVGEAVRLDGVRARAANVQTRLNVRVYKLELVAVGVDLNLARVVVTLECDKVSERDDGAILVFPVRLYQTIKFIPEV